MDNALISFECFHYIKKRISGRNGMMALKLDMSKAYDRVEWPFLRSILTHMGFPMHWFNLIMDCEAECIKSILTTYERASGQVINLDKSLLSVSRNVLENCFIDLQQLLGVKAVDSYDKYLGLPTIIGKSKSRIFSFLKERVWKKLKGWKEKTLSRAGREVLIKAVAQAIPSYVMSCFILPDDLCDEIKIMISRFYWGGDVTRRGIHWTNWKTLCQPKRIGGLGFRDFKSFNMALVAKNWWRIQNFPESLLGRLFKAVYFPSGNLIDAKKGYRPSYAWSSILKTSSMIQEGSCWRIGDGEQVRIWNDNWLPSGPPINFRHEAVDEHHCSNFIYTYSTAIDCLFWLGTADGVYTVKTGYGWLQQLATQNCLSSSHEVGLEPVQWEKFWKAPSLPRVREVAWRVCTELIPVRVKLRRCDVDVHLFLSCNASRGCWFASNLGLRSLSGMKMAEFMGWVVTEMELEVVADVQRILFAMWEARNKLIFEEKPWSMASVLARAAALVCVRPKF
ncbi:uncharacterized protein LOC130744566 [Lotus japonicus]|uniref:uncharacterized protein LOC130744566 n=1 Tax=Lotus japonicus TaxID=34305 RepID=UPI00258C6B59|nr:uncharacterized protein LOC130744566 [Lotus japonicus]